MRVALITLEYITEKNFDGGIANQFFKTAVALKNFGHEPIVFVASSKNETIWHRGIKIIRVKPSSGVWYGVVTRLTRFKFKYTIDSLFWSWWMKRAIQKEHFLNPIDITHYVNINGMGVLRNRKIPSVLLAGHYEKWYKKANGQVLKTLQEKQPLFLEQINFRRADNVYTSSFVVQAALKKDLNVEAKVIETPFMLEVKEEKLSILNTIKERIGEASFFLFFGRLGLWKGVIDIADILPEIFRNYDDIHFVFIGKDKYYQGKPVQHYIEEKAQGFKDRVHIYPPIRHAELYPIIRAAKAVVLPSRAENLANAAIETMALGQILIGTRGASFDQLIVDEKNGFLCEIANPDTILNAVQKVLNLSEAQRAQISAKAFSTVKRLEPEKVVGQLVDFYKETIQKNRRYDHRFNAGL